MPTRIHKQQPDEMFYIRYVREKNKKRKKPILVDVGMSNGDFTGNFLMAFPDAVCYGIEPCEDANRTMEKFTKEDNVTLYNIALGDKKEEKLFYDAGLYGGCSSFYKRNRFGNKFKSYMTPIDTYDNLFGNMNVFYLKLDAEGYEGHILKGAEKSLEKGLIKYIQFEYKLYAFENEIEAFNPIPLLSERYRIFYKIFKGKFIELPPDYDNTPTEITNFLAIRRKR